MRKLIVAVVIASGCVQLPEPCGEPCRVRAVRFGPGEPTLYFPRDGGAAVMVPPGIYPADAGIECVCNVPGHEFEQPVPADQCYERARAHECLQ